METYSRKHIAASGTHVIKTSGGELGSISINTTSAGAITIYDDITAGGEIIAVIKASVGEGSFEFNCRVINGLTIKTAGNSDITVMYI